MLAGDRRQNSQSLGIVLCPRTNMIHNRVRVHLSHRLCTLYDIEKGSKLLFQMLPRSMVSFLFASTRCQDHSNRRYTVVAYRMASSGCSSLESDDGSPQRRHHPREAVPGTRHLLEESCKILSLLCNISSQNGLCR